MSVLTNTLVEPESDVETDEKQLFVYGTLREEFAPPAILHDFVKRASRPFPTIEPWDDCKVQGQIITVDEYPDAYEGYSPNDLVHSLYWRLPIADSDVQVYVGNPNAGNWGVDYSYDEVRRALQDTHISYMGVIE